MDIRKHFSLCVLFFIFPIKSYCGPPYPYSEYGDIAYSSDRTKATAVWVGQDSQNSIILSSSATISEGNENWSPPVRVSSEWKYSVMSLPKVAISNDGTKATAIWDMTGPSDNDNWNIKIQSSSATIIGNESKWSDSVDLAPLVKDGTVWAMLPDVSVSGDGRRAIAIWEYYSDGPNGYGPYVQASLANIDGNSALWSTPVNVKEISMEPNPKVSISDDGKNAVAVFHGYDENYNITTESASARIYGDRMVWTDPIEISSKGEYSLFPDVGVSNNGNIAIAAWGSGGIKATWSKITGNKPRWEEPIVIGPGSTGYGVRSVNIVFSSDGKMATLTWSDNGVPRSAIAYISGNKITWSIP